MARLRGEAGLEVSLAKAGPAEIVVETVPAAELSREAPGAACFVVPGASSWAEFLAGRSAPAQDWAQVTIRTHAAVFLPADAPPQELRDCLHEEVAQALGPLNDLYRLPDSVFNDDNVQGSLTGFDMLVLRALNDPELSAGMTRAEVAARLPALLARLNPAGEAAGASGLGVSAAWAEAMGTALARREPAARRREAALSAVGTAPEPVARGLALVALGRTEAGRDPEAARAAFDAAEATLSGRPATELHGAQAALQLAALALRQGDGARAATVAGSALAVAEAHGDARLLATLLFLRAEGLDLLEDAAGAEAARLDGLTWARYGFGDEGAWTRLDEVRTLVPAAAEGGA